MSQALELNQKDSWYPLIIFKVKLQSEPVPPGGPNAYGVSVAARIALLHYQIICYKDSWFWSFKRQYKPFKMNSNVIFVQKLIFLQQLQSTTLKCTRAETLRWVNYGKFLFYIPNISIR